MIMNAAVIEGRPQAMGQEGHSSSPIRDEATSFQRNVQATPLVCIDTCSEAECVRVPHVLEGKENR
jgi:hypothetical protein